MAGNVQGNKARTQNSLGWPLAGAALLAFAAGFFLLQGARASVTSINNAVAALVVNALAVILAPVALAMLFGKRGLIGGLCLALAWAGGAGFLLNQSMEANAAAQRAHSHSSAALSELKSFCAAPKGARDERAKAFDPASGASGLVVVIASSQNPRASARVTRIEDADLLACVNEIEKVIETCSYESTRNAKVKNLQRVQVTSEMRFIAIKTGEEVWRTTVEGGLPRKCGEFEDVTGSKIRGNPPNPSGVYNEHFPGPRY